MSMEGIIRHSQHAHSFFKKWVSVPTTFGKSGYRLKNLGTLYKKTYGNFVLKFILKSSFKDPAKITGVQRVV